MGVRPFRQRCPTQNGSSSLFASPTFDSSAPGICHRHATEWNISALQVQRFLHVSMIGVMGPSLATGFHIHRSFEGSQCSPMYLRCHKPSQIRSLKEGYNRTPSVPSLRPRSFATSWELAAVPSAPRTHSSSYVRREQGFTSRRCRVLPRAFNAVQTPTFDRDLEPYTPLPTSFAAFCLVGPFQAYSYTCCYPTTHSKPTKITHAPSNLSCLRLVYLAEAVPSPSALLLFRTLRLFYLVTLPYFRNLAATVLTWCIDILPSDASLDLLYY